MVTGRVKFPAGTKIEFSAERCILEPPVPGVRLHSQIRVLNGTHVHHRADGTIHATHERPEYVIGGKDIEVEVDPEK